MSEWQTAAHASAYVERPEVSQKQYGYIALLDEVPARVRRVLDIGAGDGRLLDSILNARPGAQGVALDFSPFMLDRLRERFANRPGVEVVEHNLESPLLLLGSFDLVVSSFAIHHVVDPRKREVYQEVWTLLEPGGVFCNLEHVSSASDYGHEQFLRAMGITAAEEDPSNKLLDVPTQLEWLRQIGFSDVDCYWKWRELALLLGRKPTGRV